SLYVAVENFLRNANCTRLGIPAGSCVLAAPPTPPTAFLLWQTYRVTLAHARTLVDTLTEAMFGPTPSRQVLPASYGELWYYGDLFGGGASTTPFGGSVKMPAEQLTMHFFGNNQFTGDVSSPLPVGDVVLDPN